jgi:16S rRNA processing protein RimM
LNATNTWFLFLLKIAPYTKNDFLRIRFEDMNTEEDADAIMGNDIYLPLKMLPNLPVTNSTFMKLLVLKSDKRLGCWKI